MMAYRRRQFLSFHSDALKGRNPVNRLYNVTFVHHALEMKICWTLFIINATSWLQQFQKLLKDKAWVEIHAGFVTQTIQLC